MIGDLLEDWPGRIFAAVLLVIIVALPFLIYKAVQEQHAWEAWCRDNGGHVKDVSKTTTGTGIDSKGNPVVTTGTETTYYCLTEDGRVLDIR